MREQTPLFSPYIINGVSDQQGGPGDFDRSLHGPVLDPEDEELMSYLGDDDDL